LSIVWASSVAGQENGCFTGHIFHLMMERGSVRKEALFSAVQYIFLTGKKI
jgi:hypothetical protein